MTSIQIPKPFPSTLNPQPPPSTFNKPSRVFIVRSGTAGDDSESQTNGEQKEKTSTTTTNIATTESDDSFENRLAQVRLKYRSGTGKKAEKRRSKKTGGNTTSSKKSGTVMLPPVPLKEPVTAAGLKVDVGFSPYSEMLNGRLAALGLTALVLVELGSGKGILSYHAPPILFIQAYTVSAAAALFIKFEKERISIWPEKAPSEPESSSVIGD